MDEKDRHIVTFGEEPESSADSAGSIAPADARDPAPGTGTGSSASGARTNFSYDIDIPGSSVITSGRSPEAVSGRPTGTSPSVSVNAEISDPAPVPEITQSIDAAPAPDSSEPASGVIDSGVSRPSSGGTVVRLDDPQYGNPAAKTADTPAKPAETAPAAPAVTDGTASAHKAPASSGQPYRPEHSSYSGPQHAAPAQPKRQAAIKAPKEKKYVTKGVLVAFMIITMIISSALGALCGMAFSKTGSGSAPRNDSELSQLNLSDATGSELLVSEIIEKNADAVVEIVVSGTTQGMWGQLQLTQGAGSGVIVKENGYIATNYHVIQGANKVEVTLHNGESYPATIVGSDAENDIAVIKIDAKDLTAAVIGDSSSVKVGDLAVAIGNPLGQLGGTATSGIISALDRTLNIEGTTLTLIQTDAAINGGNSGGGLFNSKGELIGIVESKASAVGVEGLAFALPINSVSEIINDMIKNGGSTKTPKATPAVGVVISDVSENNAQYYGLEAAGVYIAQVTGRNAMNAGFKEMDRIISFNGKEVSNSSDFISLVRKCKVGDTVTIVVSRDGQEMEIKTVLEELESTQAQPLEE